MEYLDNYEADIKKCLYYYPFDTMVNFPPFCDKYLTIIADSKQAIYDEIKKRYDIKNEALPYIMDIYYHLKDNNIPIIWTEGKNQGRIMALIFLQEILPIYLGLGYKEVNLTLLLKYSLIKKYSINGFEILWNKVIGRKICDEDCGLIKKIGTWVFENLDKFNFMHNEVCFTFEDFIKSEKKYSFQ